MRRVSRRHVFLRRLSAPLGSAWGYSVVRPVEFEFSGRFRAAPFPLSAKRPYNGPMRPYLKIVPALLIGLVAIGCAGDNGFRIDEFRGDWSGTQAFIPPFGGAQDGGFITLHIDDNGVITGAISRTGVGDSVQVTGSVDFQGEMTLDWQFAGENARHASGEARVDGGQLRPTASNGQFQVISLGQNIGGLQFVCGPVLPG